MLTTICKKGTQSLNYFASKKEGKINKMKAIKLVYFADRYHLRKYGRPVVGDVYMAMKFGPVASNTLNLANLENDRLDAECAKYINTFIKHPKHDLKKEHIESKQKVDIDVFSKTDIEALEAVYAQFGDQDRFELAELTHIYPEWSKFGKDLKSGKRKSVRMEYMDFFANPKGHEGEFFSRMVTDKHLNAAKEIFKDRTENAFALS